MAPPVARLATARDDSHGHLAPRAARSLPGRLPLTCVGLLSSIMTELFMATAQAEGAVWKCSDGAQVDEMQ